MRTNKTIQSIVFKKIDSEYKFLILKYSKGKGSFYQNMTGGVDDTDNSLFGALIRELDEELKLDKKDIITLLPEIYYFEFKDKNNTSIYETVFAIEVGVHFNPTLSDEHESFKWMNYDEAIKNVKFDTNKESLKILFKMLSN